MLTENYKWDEYVKIQAKKHKKVVNQHRMQRL